jgi:hypothetical protein
VTLPAVAAAALAEHLATYSQPGRDGLVFTSTEGGLLRRSNFHRRVWRRATRAAGLEGLRFHDLRHTSATLSIAAGASTRELMARMGHSSSAAALRYQHVLAGRDAAIAAALDELIEAASALAESPPSAPSGTRVARIGNPTRVGNAAEEKDRPVTCWDVVVELRGFEPLTPCMPSRKPSRSAPHEALHRRPFRRSCSGDAGCLSWPRAVRAAAPLLPAPTLVQHVPQLLQSDRGLCRVKRARAPRAPMRHPTSHHYVAAQRLWPTEVTKCSVWRCEASFLANLWQLATHQAQTTPEPRVVEAQPARAPAWCGCWPTTAIGWWS